MARYARHTLRSGKYNNGIVKRRGIGRYVFLFLMIILLIGGILYLFKFLDSKNYNDEDSFIEYAEKHFSKAVNPDDLGQVQEKYLYGKPASTALKYTKVGSSYLNKEIKNRVERRRDDFLAAHEDGKKNEKFALLVSTDTYSSDSSSSVVISSVEKTENEDGKLEQTKEKIDVFIFDKKNKTKLYPIMVFETGYQKKLEHYFDNYLKEEYSDIISSNYKEYISAKDNKFDKFALDGSKVIFYFDSGTVTKGGEAVKIEISKSDIEGLFREEQKSRKIDPNKPMVAITFEDGPVDGLTKDILDILEKNEAVATFFELGERVDEVKNSKKILKRMVELGCEVGSHGYTHKNLLDLKKEEVVKEKEKTDKAIKNAIGDVPGIYRPPYGAGNEDINKIFNRASILWTLDTFDWQTESKQNILDTIKAEENLDGQVILLHEIYKHSVEATKELIPWLKEQGYQLVTVTELMIYRYSEDPTQVKTFGKSFFNIENVERRK